MWNSFKIFSYIIRQDYYWINIKNFIGTIFYIADVQDPIVLREKRKISFAMEGIARVFLRKMMGISLPLTFLIFFNKSLLNLKR